MKNDIHTIDNCKVFKSGLTHGFYCVPLSECEEEDFKDFELSLRLEEVAGSKKLEIINAFNDME